MAFTYGQLKYTSNAAEPAFELMEAMIDAGWRVLGSSNYSSYENYPATAGTTGTGSGGQYDLITSVSALTQKVINVGCAWRRLATPVDAPHYREILFYTQYLGSVVNTEWRWEWARDGETFTTGASATTPPSADYAVAMGSRNPARATDSLDCSMYAAPVGTAWYAYAVGDVDENYDFILYSWKVNTTSPSIYSAFGSVYLASTYPGNGDTDADPYMYIAKHRTSDGTPAYTDIRDFFEADTSDTLAETASGVTITSGVFASWDYYDYLNVDSGTYRMGMTHMAPRISGTTTAYFDQSPGYALPHVDLNGTAPISGFHVVKDSGGSGIHFIKGYYAGNLLKTGRVLSTNAQPFLIQPAEGQGSIWYVNFQGLCIAWEPRKGMVV